MTETHTPLPWASDPMKLGCLGDISTADGVSCIAQVQQIAGDDREQSERRRLTAFIVHAVNSHHDLIEALRHVTACLVDELGNLADENEVADEDLAAVLGIDYARQIIAARLRIRQARAILTKEAGRG